MTTKPLTADQALKLRAEEIGLIFDQNVEGPGGVIFAYALGGTHEWGRNGVRYFDSWGAADTHVREMANSQTRNLSSDAAK